MNRPHASTRVLTALTALGLSAVLPQNVRAQGYTFLALNDPLAGTASGQGTFTLGIAGTGAAVGYYLDSSGGAHGFVYTPGAPTPYATLNDPGAAPGKTYASGLTDAGQVVGAYLDAVGTSHGFVYTPGASTPYVNIDDPAGAPGNNHTLAAGVSGDGGAVVGQYQDSGKNFHGFVYTPGASTPYANVDDPLAAPGHDGGSSADGINRGGVIVGTYFDAAGSEHGFVYTPGAPTPYVTLNDPFAAPGVNVGTSANGLNDSGQVVGSFFNGTNHGFVYTPGAASPFATLDDPFAATAASGGTFAEGLTSNGRVAGYYLDAAGLAHGFLATPNAAPEPSGLVILALGGAGLARLRVCGCKRRGLFRTRKGLNA